MTTAVARGGGARHTGGSSKGQSLPAERDYPANTYSLRVAARVRKLRKERGWNVPALTKQINAKLDGPPMAQSTVHGWDNGSRKIDPDYYPLLARVFGVTVHELLPAK